MTQIRKKKTSMMAQHSRCRSILRLAAQGWKLLPCMPRGKKPLLKKWQKLASSDPVALRKWAKAHDNCNWAVACGPESGIFVLDIDGGEGRKSLAELERCYGPLPPTLTSITGRKDGGEHRFFVYPRGQNIRSNAGIVGKGIDVRGIGGCAIVPPSIHNTGLSYRWKNRHRVADAPDWLLQRMTETTPRTVPDSVPSFHILPQGRRNDGLTSVAGYLRRRGAIQTEIELQLLAANERRCIPPLPVEEVRRIAASVARYPVGGPDPLELAWKAAQARPQASLEATFWELCRQLQIIRQGQPIALPLVRIAGLMEVHFTTVSVVRKRAVREDILLPISESYVPHRRAGEYWFRGLYNHIIVMNNGRLERVVERRAVNGSLTRNHS